MKHDKVEDFEFHISSADNTGLIQLPDIIGNEQVIDIRVVNKPKGTYEIFMGDFEESFDMNYVIYEASHKKINSDEIHFELKTTSGSTTKVIGKLSSIRDSHCQGPNPLRHYNFRIENITSCLKAGEKFKIPIDGFDETDEASNSLLPYCETIQNYGFRPSILIGLGKDNLFPQTRCCSYSFGNLNPHIKNDNIGFSHDQKDGPLFISGTIPTDARPGQHKLMYAILIHKLKNGSFLPNFKLYPEASWEWDKLLTVHKYGIITLDIKP